MQENSQDKPVWRQKADLWKVKEEGLDADLERLERDGYETLTPEEFYRLKTWGVCSQRTPGLHMIRIRIPGGRISADQLRGIAETSKRFADGSAHITTRQNLELHSVESRNVRNALEEIAHLDLTTRSSCGHTVRNVMGCTLSGICAEEVFDTAFAVEALHEFFTARAAHYNARFPARLNIYVGGCPRCMSHAQINDLGFVATRMGGEEGFQLWAAGSAAASPRIANLLFSFVPREEVVAAAQAVADVYCEHGSRQKPPNKARLKFLVHDWGLERFAGEVHDRLRTLRPGTRVSRESLPTTLGHDRRAPGGHRGIFPQRQPGYVRIEARVRLGDLTGVQLEMLGALAECYADGAAYLTKEQNAELHWIRAESAPEVADALEEADLIPRGAGSLVDVQVCAGTEWCVFGIGDSRGLASDIESTLEKVVDSDPNAAPLRVHISGCHRGCAQHHAADVGMAAVKVDEGEGYEVFGGGRLGMEPAPGRRLGRVPLADSSKTMTSLLKAYLTERQKGEQFTEFLERTGAPRG